MRNGETRDNRKRGERVVRKQEEARFGSEASKYIAQERHSCCAIFLRHSLWKGGDQFSSIFQKRCQPVSASASSC